MSSISPSERSSSNDEIRRIREEYERQEAESAKRKSKEIHSLTEKYDKDLDNVRDSYDQQLSKTRDKQAETIEERDRRHADDVAKMRETYLGTLKRKAEEDYRDRNTIRQSHDSEMEKFKEISDQQLKAQQRNFASNVKERERESSTTEAKAIQEMQDKLQDRTRKLGDKHELELHYLTKNRDEERRNADEKFADLRANDRDELKAVKRMDREELARRTKAHENLLQNQEHDNTYLVETQKKELVEENQHLRDHYRGKYEEEAGKMGKLREHYANEIENRTGSIIRAAQTEASEARNEQILDSINDRRLRDLDHEHLERAADARIKDLERQRDDIYGVVNERARDKVGEVISRTDKILASTDRRVKGEVYVGNLKNKEALNEAERANKDSLATINTRTDSRIRTIMRTANQGQQSQIRNHEEALESLRKDYNENLNNQREAQLETMKQTYSRMEQRLRDLEVNWMKKHDALVEYYEAKNADTVDKSKEELRKLAEGYETRFTNREKAVKMEEESIEQKYQQKMALQEEAHRKELDRIEKRNQEQLQAVASRTAAAMKKA